jgi:peptide/nickel transport system substrate-binding protein
MIMNDGAALFLGYPQTNIISSKALAGVKMYPSDYYWITNLIKPAK